MTLGWFSYLVEHMGRPTLRLLRYQPPESPVSRWFADVGDGLSRSIDAAVVPRPDLRPEPYQLPPVRVIPLTPENIDDRIPYTIKIPDLDVGHLEWGVPDGFWQGIHNSMVMETRQAVGGILRIIALVCISYAVGMWLEKRGKLAAANALRASTVVVLILLSGWAGVRYLHSYGDTFSPK